MAGPDLLSCPATFRDPGYLDSPTRLDAVLMAIDDYRALEETAYLLRSPANVRRLLESLQQARTGTVEERELDR